MPYRPVPPPYSGAGRPAPGARHHPGAGALRLPQQHKGQGRQPGDLVQAVRQVVNNLSPIERNF